MVDDNSIGAPFHKFRLEGEGFSVFRDEKDGEEVFQADISKVALVPEPRC